MEQAHAIVSGVELEAATVARLPSTAARCRAKENDMQPSARLLALLLCVIALVTADNGEAQPVSATLMTSVSPAHCVQAQNAGTGADLIRCPTPLRAALAEAATVCRDAGGMLSGAQEGNVWSIDVNGDERQELVFELDGNVQCEGAYSVFSCGSLGCPKSLYELRDGQWTVIGSLYVSVPEELTLAATPASDGHRTLEVCAKQGCAERWFYEWLGTAYDSTRLEVRGAPVDVAGSIHGLYTLAAATTLRATPTANAADVGRYDAGTDVAIIGTADGGAYYYVSPCNACESGFAPRAAVTVP
jgi:hypothetical protein